LARQTAGNCEFFSLVIPPLAFRDLDGVLYGVQSGSLLDRPALGELKDLICAKLTTKPPGSHIWDQKRDDFLKVAAHAASRYLAEEDVKRIAIVRYEWERDDSPTITFHTKLRIVLKNETSNAFEIESALWSSGSVGVPLFDASQPIKWQLKRGDPEKIPIHVPAGSEAHTWIGISDSVNFPDCLNRCASKRTGTLHLMVKINHLVSHELHF
jgi:hypothetical protein